MFEPDVLRQEGALIACRRRLHERPELSFHEFETTEYLENALREMGVDELSRPCKTGLIAVIHGTKPGKATTQRNLAGHSQVTAHLTLRKG